MLYNQQEKELCHHSFCRQCSW